MISVYDLRPVRTILAECRDLRRQVYAFPSCRELASRRLRSIRVTLAAIRHNRHELRREARHG